MGFYNRGEYGTMSGKMSKGMLSIPSRLVLASQSPRRRELLKLMGLPFEVTAADVAEAPRADETPVELVTRLSRAKADAASAVPPPVPGPLAETRGIGRAEPDCQHRDDVYPHTLVIACDTIVALEKEPGETRVLGKPHDPEEAMEMLRLLRGNSHLVYSAVTVLDGARHTTTELAETQLTMRAYTESEIAAYVASGDPLDKAGAYAIQHQGFHPVREIAGCYASVMGLPLCHLTRCLRRWGCSPTTDVPTACQAHTDHRCEVYREIIGS